MTDFAAVTDDDLAKARRDPEFKHKLMAANLDRLLTKLSKLQRANSEADPKLREQIRAAVEVALELSRLIEKAAAARPGSSRAP
jgi:hypothetical protein